MGLDCSHNAFHGAYSSFNRFRQFVSKSIGGSYPPHEDKSLNEAYWYLPDGMTSETHKGLYEFLGHSDCDGEISPEMCKIVADELEAIIPQMKELEKTTEAVGHTLRDGGYVAVAKSFIKGCRIAHQANEPLRFM